MKNKLFILLGLLLTINMGFSQNDTLCIYRNGVMIFQRDVNDIDSIVFNASQSSTYGSFVDLRDNTVYQTITIGTQTWMSQNLAYLPSVSPPSEFSLTSPFYYVYGYNGNIVANAKATTNYTIYGVLYNWPAAMNGASSSSANPSGIQGICPNGWHLPSDAEWTQLSNYLGGENVAGGKLKESGTIHWTAPNNGATNETFFTGLPGGYRNYNGTFVNIKNFGIWWSSTQLDSDLAYRFNLYCFGTALNKYDLTKEVGVSVRCVMD